MEPVEPVLTAPLMAKRPLMIDFGKVSKSMLRTFILSMPMLSEGGSFPIMDLLKSYERFSVSFGFS